MNGQMAGLSDDLANLWPNVSGSRGDCSLQTGADFYVPPSATRGGGAHALTAEQWDAIGTSPDAGDFRYMEYTGPMEALRRVPGDWSIGMQGDNNGITFTDPAPDYSNPYVVNELRIKPASGRWDGPDYESYALARLGVNTPGNVDQFGFEYRNNAGRIPLGPKFDATWNRQVHIRLPWDR